MPLKQKKNETDWSKEITHAMGVAGKFFVKVLSWVLNIFCTCLLIGLITGTIVGGAFVLYVMNYVDSSVDNIDFLKVSENTTTKICYINENNEIVELENQRLYGSSNHIWAPYESFPDDLVNAIVSIEDHRYWQHGGVDWLSTVKNAAKYFTGTGMAGASTITQQLIKNVTGNDEVSIQRKAKEIMQAMNLTKKMSKEQVLELYLNTIYLGQGCDGVSAAAYKYFGKEVQDLTLLECAALVGITQNPLKWDPIRNPENNTYRRQVVLTAMREYGYISDEEYYSVYYEELELNTGDDNEDGETATSEIKSWYTDAAIEETISLLMKEYGYTYDIAEMKIYTGGFQIVTAQNLKLQRLVEEFYADKTKIPRADESLIQPQSSFVLIDPETGNVLALAGGTGEKDLNRGLNYATQTKRPSGSSIKPISAYAPALEYGVINWGSVLDDSPVNFGTETVHEDGSVTYSRPGGYPKNATNYYRGLSTVHYAVNQSINTIAYKTVELLGLDRSFDFTKNLCHVSSLIESYDANGTIVTDKAYAPLALGQQSYGVTNLELTAAYSILANNGVYNNPRIVLQILDGEGNVVIDNPQESEIVIKETTASIMTKMLQEVVQVGTGSRITLKNSVDVAGKTGTTQSQCDKWFIGYTPYFIGGVWFGYSMPQALTNFGSNPALSIWDALMTEIHQDVLESAAAGTEELKHFETADGVITAKYCVDSGKLVTEACLADPRGSRVETGYFTADNMPNSDCDVHVLVDYDTVTKSIATNACPSENLVKVALLNYKRSFVRQVSISDAQYMYWQLPEGIAPGGTENDPFFINAIPKDKFVGITGGTTQFNHSCQEHKHSDNPPVTEPDETIAPPPETGDEPETEEPLAGEETGYTPPPEGE